MAGFFELIETMAGQDFFVGLLPFIVSYSVFYLALRNVPLFTDDGSVTDKGNQFAAVISIAAAFMVARFMYLNPFYQTYFVEFFGQLVVGVVGLLGLMTVLGFIGFEFGDFPGDSWIPMGVAISMAGAAFLVAGGFGPSRNLMGTGTTEAVSMILNSPITWMLPALAALAWITFGTGGDSSESSDDGGG